ncbi:hypothetical protein GCM10011375_01430 [Hymenobacter qilianensis]|uniref:Uncharacterized protein n=1 Tax=Hymenobacter qilianensis TaxID=1385715 RepID=A0ACB5PL65_9BACT|nr:hypothetical protein GCM10011375_01430 [Hymenobacter qilianensis]
MFKGSRAKSATADGVGEWFLFGKDGVTFHYLPFTRRAPGHPKPNSGIGTLTIQEKAEGE